MGCVSGDFNRNEIRGGDTRWNSVIQTKQCDVQFDCCVVNCVQKVRSNTQKAQTGQYCSYRCFPTKWLVFLPWKILQNLIRLGISNKKKLIFKGNNADGQKGSVKQEKPPLPKVTAQIKKNFSSGSSSLMTRSLDLSGKKSLERTPIKSRGSSKNTTPLLSPGVEKDVKIPPQQQKVSQFNGKNKTLQLCNFYFALCKIFAKFSSLQKFQP